MVSAARDNAQTALGCAGCNLILWDLTRHTEVATLLGHTAGPGGLAFSRDGRMLVSSDGEEVTLWSVAQRAQMATLAGSTGPVALSQDRRLLASGSEGGDVLLWDVDASSWHQQVCALAGRAMTRAEWDSYLSGQPYRAVCK
jgi:WD40 repeat protein